ncbi:MAG: HD domain-containing protein [Planctomycetota bacterium]|nr:HD domain-containing protein [Planctomycetota bacterium]
MSDAVKRSLSQALNSGVRKYGTAIVSNLAIAIKTTQLYSFAHQNVTGALAELEEYLVSFIRLEGEAELSRVDDFLFINEVRIKVDLGGMSVYDFILGIVKERDIGAITFSEGVNATELSRVVQLLTKPLSNPDEPWKSFEAELQTTSLPNVKIGHYDVRQEKQEEITDDKRILAINLFFRAIHQMKDSFDAVQNKRRINFKRMKRVIQSMVDMVLEDEPTLLALVNIKDYGSRLANHSVNVAVLSVALGSKLGFSKKLLGDLGISALLHDLGKVNLPQELIQANPDQVSGADREALRDHVYNGVEVLLNQRIVDAVVKSMNVAFLHHFRYDSTGYPRTHVVKGQNFYSRLIAVCDLYENKSTPEALGGAGWEPDKIMRALMDGSGTEFDPLVVKAFVNLMGLYPVGCLVSLDTGELGSVVAPAANSRYLDRPTVRLFVDADGKSLDETVNLMERNGAGFRRSILKIYQQEEVELEMEEFLSVI